MPNKKQLSKISQLRGFVLKFENNVFSADSRVLFCKVCKLTVEYEQRSSVFTTYKLKNMLEWLNDGKLC